jgi:hypothetical protein
MGVVFFARSRTETRTPIDWSRTSCPAFRRSRKVPVLVAGDGLPRSLCCVLVPGFPITVTRYRSTATFIYFFLVSPGGDLGFSGPLRLKAPPCFIALRREPPPLVCFPCFLAMPCTLSIPASDDGLVTPAQLLTSQPPTCRLHLRGMNLLVATHHGSKT